MLAEVEPKAQPVRSGVPEQLKTTSPPVWAGRQHRRPGRERVGQGDGVRGAACGAVAGEARRAG